MVHRLWQGLAYTAGNVTNMLDPGLASLQRMSLQQAQQLDAHFYYFGLRRSSAQLNTSGLTLCWQADRAECMLYQHAIGLNDTASSPIRHPYRHCCNRRSRQQQAKRLPNVSMPCFSQRATSLPERAAAISRHLFRITPERHMAILPANSAEQEARAIDCRYGNGCWTANA